MKQFITKFVESETVTKEVGEVADFKKWLAIFSFEDIPKEAVVELSQLCEAAEERSKIALIDLIRLLFQFEVPTGHVVYNCWDCIDMTIFQYLRCVDIKDPAEKVLHNYHLVSLKMLGNLYQT